MKLEELYKTYGYSFVKIAYRHVRDKETAEDIVQDVFTYLCQEKYIDKIEAMPEKNAVSYILKSIDNKIIDIARRKKKIDEMLILDKDSENNTSTPAELTVASTEDYLLPKVQAEQMVEKVIEFIGMDSYKLLRDVYFDEMNKKDIAQERGITLVNLRCKLSRCRKALREKFGENWR